MVVSVSFFVYRYDVAFRPVTGFIFIYQGFIRELKEIMFELWRVPFLEWDVVRAHTGFLFCTV